MNLSVPILDIKHTILRSHIVLKWLFAKLLTCNSKTYSDLFEYSMHEFFLTFGNNSNTIQVKYSFKGLLTNKPCEQAIFYSWKSIVGVTNIEKHGHNVSEIGIMGEVISSTGG